MSIKRVLPLLIEVEVDSVPEKFHSFFQANGVAYQQESIRLWGWRSELSGDELLPPFVVKVIGTVQKELRTNLLRDICNANVTGIVACAADIMLRVGLDQEFIRELRTNGVEVWTSESIFPLPEEELSTV